MAKTTNERGLILEAKATAELKRELQRVVQAIVEEDDYDLEETDRAMHALCALKDFKLKKIQKSFNPQNLSLTLPPPEFLCPLSRELMKDPVVIASGQTYDRLLIEKWLMDGHTICPQTEQVLPHTILIHNNLLKEMISRWCKEHGIELPGPVQDTDGVIITNGDRGKLDSLLGKLSSLSLEDQKVAAKEIRQLTKCVPYFRALFGEVTDGISQLLKPLLLGRASEHPDLQEDLITAILNISIHESNKKLVAENAAAIHLLIESLKFGNIETRRNAAAALFSLSALDSNKHIIGKSGALKPLVELLEGADPLAMKDAASAIFNLCIVVENKSRAVSEGAVPVIVKKITDHLLVDELLSILAMLSSHQKAMEEMGELRAVSCLLDIIRENTSERNDENCIAILYTLCFSDRTKLREIGKEERTHGTISQLARNGTLRAKRKANAILERLKKYATTTANTA